MAPVGLSVIVSFPDPPVLIWGSGDETSQVTEVGEICVTATCNRHTVYSVPAKVVKNGPQH